MKFNKSLFKDKKIKMNTNKEIKKEDKNEEIGWSILRKMGWKGKGISI